MTDPVTTLANSLKELAGKVREIRLSVSSHERRLKALEERGSDDGGSNKPAES